MWKFHSATENFGQEVFLRGLLRFVTHPFHIPFIVWIFKLLKLESLSIFGNEDPIVYIPTLM